MEDNNTHDDKLGEYVRRSFEDYEEQPPSDMWGRIEAGLPDKSRRRPAGAWLWLRQNRWQATAASAMLLLISVSLCQRLYYERELKALRSAPIIKSTQVSPSSNQGKSAHNQINANQPQPAPTSPNQPIIKSTQINPNQQIGCFLPGHPLFHPINPSTNHQIPLLPPSLVAPQNQSLPKIRALGPTEGAEEPPTKPTRQPKGWYVGASVTPHVAFEQSKPQRALRPGLRPIFASEREKTDFAGTYWLHVGKKMGASPYFVETGLGYEKTFREAAHRPQLRFGDGSHTGGALSQRRFQYRVGTYNGTADVALRMEQTDPGAPVNDDEPIVLTIRTEETTELLRFPLLAGANWGRGWLKGSAKAGFVLNRFLRSELSITASLSQNARFRPVGGKGSYTLQMEEAGKFFPGFWLSAGASAALGKHLSVGLMPWFSGDFPRKGVQGNPLPQQFGAGLDLSAQYTF